MTSAPFVSSLHFYPIKSCGVVDLDEAQVGPRGLEVGKIGDRRWMLADEDGNFLSQRKFEKMALIRPRLILNEDGSAERMRVLAPGQGELVLDQTCIAMSERP